MISYQKEMFARERMRDLLAEAERERQARPPAADPHVDGTRQWRGRLAVAIVRRLTGVAQPC